jgi:hypothetical protein
VSAMKKMREAFFENAREDLTAALREGDTTKVNKILDDAEELVGEVIAAIPYNPLDPFERGVSPHR